MDLCTPTCEPYINLSLRIMPTTARIYLHDSSREVGLGWKIRVSQGTLEGKHTFYQKKSKVLQSVTENQPRVVQSRFALQLCLAARVLTEARCGNMFRAESYGTSWRNRAEGHFPLMNGLPAFITLTSALSKGLVHVPCMISNINKSAKQMVLGCAQELGFWHIPKMGVYPRIGSAKNFTGLAPFSGGKLAALCNFGVDLISGQIFIHPAIDLATQMAGYVSDDIPVISPAKWLVCLAHDTNSSCWKSTHVPHPPLVPPLLLVVYPYIITFVGWIPTNHNFCLIYRRLSWAPNAMQWRPRWNYGKAIGLVKKHGGFIFLWWFYMVLYGFSIS